MPSSTPQASTRLQHPRYEVDRSISRVEKSLAAAAVESFRGMSDRVRRAVLDVQPLVVALDRLVQQGFRPRQPPVHSVPMTASEVTEPVRAVRIAVGQLANTTPSHFSKHYDQFRQCGADLLKVARLALERGVEPVPSSEELDEWMPFREP